MKTHRINLRLDDEIVTMLTELAAKMHCSKTHVVVAAVQTMYVQCTDNVRTMYVQTPDNAPSMGPLTQDVGSREDHDRSLSEESVERGQKSQIGDLSLLGSSKSTACSNSGGSVRGDQGSQISLLAPDRADELVSLWSELDWYGATWGSVDPAKLARQLISRYGDDIDYEGASREASIWLHTHPMERKAALGRYLVNWIKTTASGRYDAPLRSVASNTTAADKLSEEAWLYGGNDVQR